MRGHRLTNGNCSPPIRRFGFRKTPFGLTPSAVFCSTTFCQPWSRTKGSMLHKPLSGLAKRQLPECYTTYPENWYIKKYTF